MFRRIRALQNEYPKQYWLLFWGMLVSTAGISLIWPFLTIYLREKLDLPLTTIAFLITISSVAALFSSLVIGPVMDRFGRKGVMITSLFLSAVIFSLMSFAQTLPQFVILMALRGAFAPLYSVAADAMVADLIADKKRSEAYSLLRIINNVGIALGPAIGGFITTGSYTAAFILGSSSLAIFGLLVIFTIRETAPALVNTSHIEDSETSGYRVLFKDNLFISFCGSITLARIMPALVFVLLSVYVKENFAIPESQFGFLMTTNAIIVVLFQFSVTRLVSKLPPLRVLAFGSLIYAVGIGSIALGENFWAFMASMVVLTFGELLIAPTGTTLASQLAPAAQRGRYMSVYSLTVGIARGIGPVFGGMLNDNLSPAAIWYGGSAAGILAFIWFLGLFFQRRNRDAAENILTQTSSGDAS